MESEFIYNAHNTGAFCHSASMEEFDGELFVTWYAYPDKEYENGQICITKRDLSTGEWFKSFVPFSQIKNSSCGNPVLYADHEKNELHIFFVVLQRHYWDSAQVFHSVLSENKQSWSSPELVSLPEATMIRHRFLKLSNHILIPAYNEKTHVSYVFKSQHPYNEWDILTTINEELIQGDLIKMNETELQLYLRPAGDSPHFIYKALSPDGGVNFNTILKTTLHCPLSGIAACRLTTGDIIICHNDTEVFKRNPLSLSVLRNGQVKYEKVRDLEVADMELSYPMMIQGKSRDIHIIYTYNRKLIKYIGIKQSELKTYGL